MKQCAKFFASVLAGLLWLVAPAWPQALVIPGSGDWEAALRQLAEAFVRAHPSQSIEIPPSTGSSGGFRNVLNNSAVMGRVARQPRAEQLRSGIKWHPVARDAVVFAVGERVELKTLTATELAAVFGGRITDWRELGARPAPIRVLVRESTDSVPQIIGGRLEPFRNLAITEQAKMVVKTDEMVEMLGRYRTSIGWITQSALVLAKSGAQPIALDGVPPSAENLGAGKYPLWIDYALIYREDRLDRTARDFLAFIASEEGRVIIRRAGLVPLGN
jgi:phosphate transport system substrate-binding protein